MDKELTQNQCLIININNYHVHVGDDHAICIFSYNNTPNPSHGGRIKLMWLNTHMMAVLH